MRNYISLSLIVLICFSCYEKEEGCLEIRAKNYDFEADVPCEDCCTYPSMKISVSHTWGDTTLMTDSTYINSTGQAIRILNAQFILSDISLIDGEGSKTVLEVAEVMDVNGVSFTRPDNFAEVRTSLFSYTVGTFSQASTFTGLQFTFGVDDRFTNEGIVDNTSMFDEATLTYTNFQMQYVREMDTLSYSLIGPVNSRDLTFMGLLDLPVGVDFTLPLAVDYENLLDGVDLDFLGSNEADLRILNNLAGFFNP